MEETKELTKEQKFKSISLLSKALDKAHTDEKIGRIVTNSLIRLGSRPVLRVPCISTGLPTVDYDVLQYGGIPRGRIIEMFGPESAGKTTTALHIIAQAQKAGGIAHFEDAEHKLEPLWAKQLGVNIDDLLFNQPNSGEEALDSVDKLVESKCVDLIVVDSAAALVTEAELAGDIGDVHVGQQARMLSQAMRILAGKCAANKVTIIFINQIREKIGVMFGNPETTPGGRALKFYSSVRLNITRPMNTAITSGSKENIVGHSLDIRCVKNGGGIPFRRTQIDLIYPGDGRQVGFDAANDTIQFAQNNNLLSVEGNSYFLDFGMKDSKGKPIGPEKVAVGFEKFKQYVRNEDAALQVIRKQVEDHIKRQQEGVEKEVNI